jgi:uncharacterized membrane protein YoaK (UPF0700 family)
MQDKINEIPSEFWNFMIKTLPFSLAALAASIAIQIKNKTASVVNVILSIVIGISCAWITGGFINVHFSSSTAPIIIGVVTIAGEKIGYWLVYKFNFDVIGQAIIDAILKKIKKK